MNIKQTNIPEVLIIESKVFSDDRGFFYEAMHEEKFQAMGIKQRFVQTNISRSKKNVLRGLHYQKQHTQGKLISVIKGSVFDVAVDVRHDSPTFKQWVGTVLDDQKHQQLYIPPGFAHGFCVLSDEADFIYECTDFYDANSEITIIWNDADIHVDWPIQSPILSPKDQKGLRLKDLSQNDLLTVD